MAVVTVTAAALMISALAAFAVERGRIVRQAEESLDRDGRHFAAFAATSDDPVTGRPFASASDLLRAGMVLRTAGPTEGSLALVGGDVTWVGAEGADVRPEFAAGFLAHVRPLARAASATQDRYTDGDVDYAYVVVPVRIGPDQSGALVRVVDLRAAFAGLGDTVRTFALTATGALLLSGALAAVLMTRLLEPLAWLRQTAEGIGEADLATRIPVRGHDDLTALTRTVNGMLDRVEHAVTDRRRLLEDVAHELRTPMTVVRGHLDLVDPANPGDVTRTVTLAAEELDRMSRLVDDLTVLATAERPDFVSPIRYDVGQLTRDTVEHAHVLGARRWRLDEAAEVEVELDPFRITQAWQQLVSNAVRYSEPGSAVGIGSRLTGGSLRMWVRDEGIGIAPADRDVVLRRWGRGSTGPGGEAAAQGHSLGLGLTIVDAIVTAHRGRLEIDSAAGRGSLVTMVIPAGDAAPPSGDAAPTAAAVPVESSESAVRTR